ncbi:MAG TPA: hypothetical protein VL358_04725 [Caulobacteraceae bacterium]|jgi:hypothetical protein|nr:hypothetical protein [Caulobacteraceae bacterium]
MSPFARRAWRQFELQSKRAAEGLATVADLVRAWKGANAVRCPVEADDVQAAATELLSVVDSWFRSTSAKRDALRPRIAFLAALVGEGLDESAPKPSYRADVDG